ncbi:hypothetical protein [Nocardia terpenica]|uniref:Uncharacterized protein n=1 Tax=Nocardia terpenica TaxID=455432 RepID=A0A6G9Z7D3_9NOCA|nr:hypothetical protein [Nocardia terpenica]QIS20923.1 hypothetical protein F6W96_24005 [Nocardia terpenica]
MGIGIAAGIGLPTAVLTWCVCWPEETPKRKHRKGTRRQQMANLAYVYTKLGDDRQCFELPRNEDEFRTWTTESRSAATDRTEFDRCRNIVLWHLSHMPDANAAGMYQVITWCDDNRAPVVVEHHQFTA